MKHSKQQVENAILFFAKEFGQEANYKGLIQTCPVTPKIVEMIVYEMFLQKSNPSNYTDEQLEQYQIIHEYSTELKQVGWVEYEK